MAVPAAHTLGAVMLLVLLLAVELPGSLQRCIFDEAQARVRVVRAAPAHPDSAEPTHVRARGAQFGLAEPLGASQQPIRIQPWLLRESDSLSEAEDGRLRVAMESAIRTVSSLLSVDRAPGPLLLSRDINKYCKFLWRNSGTRNYNRCGRANNKYRTETCLDVTIPDDHLAGCDVYPEADSTRRIVLRPGGAGLPDTDFLLYLQVKATDKCRAEFRLVISCFMLGRRPLGRPFSWIAAVSFHLLPPSADGKPNVLAYAVHCHTDTSGRPVAGVVVICRERLTGPSHDHQATEQMLIHELFHALGFSKELFHTWRDCSTRGAGCSPRSKVTHTDRSGQMRVYTPSVIAAVQKHLVSGDPELGGPLENLHGGVSSHWESRVLRGSIMAAVLGDPHTVRIDPVTLAAFQDSGWYAVNVSRAQSLVWGDGEGAMFGSLATCQKHSSFFCNSSGLGCHFLHLHKGECQTDPYLDGCHVFKPLKNGSECWKKDNERQSVDEIFGSDSRCFFSSLTTQRGFLPSSSVMGRCYRHRCTGPNSYQIQVSGSEWADCPAGGTVQMTGYQGVVFCPDRRLCVYSDVAPPSDDEDTLPVSVTSHPGESEDAARPALGRPAELTVASALGFTAAASLLAALVLSCRKCGCGGVRVHAAPREPT